MPVIVDDLLISFESYGSGPVIVLLHGWGDAARGLRPLAEALAKHYRVIVPDLPGFGDSEVPPVAWGLNDYAKFLGSFLHKMDVEPYALIGHSNGGAIAIRALAMDTVRAQKVVLLASAGVRSTYRGRKRFLRLIAKVGKVLVWPLPGRLKQRLRKKVYKAIGSDMFVAEHLQQTFKKIVTDDVLADAPKIHAPTLLIYGEQDDATPPAYGRQFQQRIPHATLRLLPQAGHFVHRDAERQVTDLVEEFLR